MMRADSLGNNCAHMFGECIDMQNLRTGVRMRKKNNMFLFQLYIHRSACYSGADDDIRYLWILQYVFGLDTQVFKVIVYIKMFMM